MNLARLKDLYVATGCTELYAKRLAPNDNSKNQIYFGPDFQALNLLPNSGVFSDSSPKNPIFKAKLEFWWLLADGRTARAPSAQLILYPQYPEVRFSGFLKGCTEAPSHLLADRFEGRVLFLGVGPSRRVVGHVVSGNAVVARELKRSFPVSEQGVFLQLELATSPALLDSRAALLSELARIHSLGWIDSKQLDATGGIRPCNAPQCGGFTLEAELNIAKNSNAEPDFRGWEVKQHNVTSFDRVEVGTITLMTPEPSGGYYQDRGPEAFIRKFGYKDRLGRADRLNFGGVHRVGIRHDLTKLTLTMTGYEEGRITDSDGFLALVSDRGEIAASWQFGKILEHWSRKHSKAVYVPSQCRKTPNRQYAYGNKVRLAERTDPLKLLKALSAGAVFYDPGIKLERASADSVIKRRSQFRVSSRDIGILYDSVELQTL